MSSADVRLLPHIEPRTGRRRRAGSSAHLRSSAITSSGKTRFDDGRTRTSVESLARGTSSSWIERETIDFVVEQEHRQFDAGRSADASEIEKARVRRATSILFGRPVERLEQVGRIEDVAPRPIRPFASRSARRSSCRRIRRSGRPGHRAAAHPDAALSGANVSSPIHRRTDSSRVRRHSRPDRDGGREPMPDRAGSAERRHARDVRDRTAVFRSRAGQVPVKKGSRSATSCADAGRRRPQLPSARRTIAMAQSRAGRAAHCANPTGDGELPAVGPDPRIGFMENSRSAPPRYRASLSARSSAPMDSRPTRGNKFEMRRSQQRHDCVSREVGLQGVQHEVDRCHRRLRSQRQRIAGERAESLPRQACHPRDTDTATGV